MKPIRKLGISCALCVAALLGARILREPAHHTKFERLINGRGMPLRVVLIAPDPRPPGRLPAVIVAQPVNTPTEYGRALTLQLVAEGYQVLTFDWRGWEPAENRQFARAGTPEVLLQDVQAAVTYLRGQPGVDPERIAATGQSAGGTLAIQAGTADPEIVAVAAIGMEADVTSTRPRNLLWALGFYDEFRTPERMRDVFWASANTTADFNATVGDFRQGTARRLEVSPTADHFTELQDRILNQEVVNWFNQACGKTSSPKYSWNETRQWLLLVAWISALLTVIWGLRAALGGARSPGLARLVPGLALVTIGVIKSLASLNPSLRQDLVQLALVAMLVVGFAERRRNKPAESPGATGAGRKALRVGILAWLSFLLTLIVNNTASYFYHPRYLLWIPVFALQHLANLAYVYTLVYPGSLIFGPTPSGVPAPRLWVYLLVAVEVVSPGIVLGTFARLAQRKPRAHLQPRREIPWAALAILAGLFVALGVVVALRLQQGFLTRESAVAAGRFLLRFAVLPIIFFLALRRLTLRAACRGAD